MTNRELRLSVESAKAETRDALQMVYDTLNQGQKKKILEDENVKKLFNRCGVNC